MTSKKNNPDRQTSFSDNKLYEVVEIAPHKSVIIVGSDTPLTTIPWLKLVEIAPGRNLITIPPETSIESLEVAILDLLEKTPPDATRELALLEELGKDIGRLRRQSRMSRADILIVDNDD